MLLLVPSPKSHSHADTGPEEVSVKVTLRGAVPEVGLTLKLAANGALAEGSEMQRSKARLVTIKTYKAE